MKPLLIGLLALVASAQISARTFTARLDNSTPIFEENFRGGAVESVTLKRGTVLTLDDDSFHHPDLGRVFLVCPSRVGFCYRKLALRRMHEEPSEEIHLNYN